MDLPVRSAKNLKTMEQITSNTGSDKLASPRKIRQATVFVPLRGIAGFHVVEEASGARLASMKMDKDISKGRVNTGNGDQPALPGTSRFGTPCKSTREDIRP